ncbi:MAG: ABC transporter permease [Alphaproteobacteria bacterium]|nr:ABC transporter permease [Alphaproteobacteria bacterium]
MTVKIKGENLILSGDLTENFFVSDAIQSLKNGKRLVIQNGGISEWNQESVVTLYSGLSQLPTSTDLQIKNLPEGMSHLLELALKTSPKDEKTISSKEDFFERLGRRGIAISRSIKSGFKFLVKMITSWERQIRGKAIYRKKDFLMSLEDCGPKAVMIVSLISFMIGLILAFVGALQLKNFGAQIYVASLVTIGMTRIMGAVMTGVIMAGRTGASYAATIGTMQVNEELDALQTMGISRIDFLGLPRMNALLMSMPILVLISDFVGILGGCFVCVFLWEIPLSEYIRYCTMAFSLQNFLVGVFHGFVFGLVITLCGCYFGITCGRNADSVGKATTNAVVYSIVWMIVMTGIITLICEGLGI